MPKQQQQQQQQQQMNIEDWHMAFITDLNSLHAFLLSADFFKSFFIKKNIFRNTIRV